MSAEQQEPDFTSRRGSESRNFPSHEPVVDGERIHAELPPTADLSEIRKEVTPLPETLRRDVRLVLLQEFIGKLPELVDRAADYFSSILPDSSEFYGDPDGEELVEHHGTAKRHLADIVGRAGALMEDVLEVVTSSSSTTDTAMTLYDEEIVPWLEEYIESVQSMVVLEQNIAEFLSDVEDELDEDEDEDDDADPDDDDGDDTVGVSDSPVEDVDGSLAEDSESALLAEALFAQEQGPEMALVDVVVPCRTLISSAQSLIFKDPLGRPAVDVNLALLELNRTQGIPVEFSRQSPRAPFEPDELKFCCHQIGALVKAQVSELMSAELTMLARDGSLYAGSTGSEIRNSVSKYFLTQFPLQAIVTDQGAVLITQNVPDILNESWQKQLPALEEKLATVAALVEARGHTLRMAYDDELHTFTVRIELLHAIAMPETASDQYCTAQQAKIIESGSVYGSLNRSTLIALPRSVMNSTREGVYNLAMEAAALPLIGKARSLDSLLKQIDRFVLAVPGIVQAGIFSGITGDELPDDVITDPYEHGGAVSIRFFSGGTNERFSLVQANDGGFDANRLQKWILNLPSDPYAAALKLAKPFPVVPPYFASAPQGQFIIIDEALVASAHLRESLARLGEAGSLRITVARDYFANYDGTEPRVELVEQVIDQLSRVQQAINHPRYAGATLEWFGGSTMNGINCFRPGMMARLYEVGGGVIAQGLIDGREGVSNFISAVDSDLLNRATAALRSLTELDPTRSTSLEQLTGELKQCGLHVDDFFLQTALWHLRQETLGTGSAIVSPAEAVSRMFQLPHITAEEKDGLILLRRTTAKDAIRV